MCRGNLLPRHSAIHRRIHVHLPAFSYLPPPAAQYPGPLDGPVTVAMLEAWQAAGMDRSMYLELLDLLKKMQVRYNRTAMHLYNCAARGVVGLGHGPPHVPEAAQGNQCVYRVLCTTVWQGK